MNSSRIVVLLLLLSGSLFAKAPVYHYLAPDSVRVDAVLTGPPAPGSPDDQQDLKAVISAQNSRTEADIARVKSEAIPKPELFANVIGPWFTPEKLPLTFALLNNAGGDARIIDSSAKKFWNRPRPPVGNPDIHPVIEVPASASYPSGHSMLGRLWSIILASVAPPDFKTRILARGDQIGKDRVIAGVHYPSDVAAGRKLAQTIAVRLAAVPAFQHDEAAATAEFVGAIPKTP